jgi:hypothetical protein
VDVVQAFVEDTFDQHVPKDLSLLVNLPKGGGRSGVEYLDPIDVFVYSYRRNNRYKKCHGTVAGNDVPVYVPDVFDKIGVLAR